MENEQKRPDDDFSTSDIYLAAFLHAVEEQVELDRTVQRESGGRKRTFFVFKGDRALIEKLQIGFVNNSAPVRAGPYAQAIIAIKKLCFSGSLE